MGQIETEKSEDPRGEGLGIHLPFLQPLQALRVQLLDSNTDPHAALCWMKGLLIDPSYVNPTKSPFANNAFWLKVPGGGPQIHKCEDSEIWRLQDLAPRASSIDRLAAAY